MTQTEFEDAKALWKFFYAHECFKQVENACSFIIDNCLGNGHPAYYPLVTAVSVLYAKPFSRSEVVGKLPTDIVPAEFGELHQSIMDQRNQLYAHTDGNAFALNGLEPANQVRLLVSQTEARLIAPLFRLEVRLIPKVLKLCQALQRKANYHIESLQKRHHREFLEPGEYAINVLDAAGPFWIKKPPLSSLTTET
jgi:hypothetical protein